MLGQLRQLEMSLNCPSIVLDPPAAYPSHHASFVGGSVTGTYIYMETSLENTMSE